MNLTEYFQKKNAQKKLDKTAKKFKNKRVALYGAGKFATTLFENYDLSKLNIVAVADRKFYDEKERNFFGLNCVSPDDLKELDIDAILISSYEFMTFWNYLEKDLLDNTKNENIKIRPLLDTPVLEYFKDLFFKEEIN